MKIEKQSRELCQYRLCQAEEALSEAMLLLDAGHYRGAVNRAYYAVFYSIQVLVVQKKAKVSKHSGVISYFDREYVKFGIFDKNLSRWLHRLFDLRQDADYGDLFDPTEEQCREAVDQAKEFVRQIKEHYKKSLDDLLSSDRI